MYSSTVSKNYKYGFFLAKNFFKQGMIPTFFLLIKLLDKKLSWNYLGYSLDFKKYNDKVIFNPKFMGQTWKMYSPKKVAEGGAYFVSDVPTLPKSLYGCIKLTSTLQLPIEQIKYHYFYVYFSSDSLAEPEVRNIIKGGGYVVPHLDATKTKYRFIDEKANKAIQQTWQIRNKLSHLDLNVHENICQALNMTKSIDGDYLEIGVYKGGSLQTAANYIFTSKTKDPTIKAKKVIGLDTFEGFNYEQAKISSDVIFQRTHKLYGIPETISYISRNLDRTGVEYHLMATNIISDPVPDQVKKVSVVNIDVDLYEATLASLFKVSPLVERFGIIICEDAASTPALYGSLVAMNEFLNTEEGRKYTKIFLGSSYFLIKNKI